MELLLVDLTLAASATDAIDRWGPVVLFAVACFVLWLRARDRRRGPDPDDDEDWD